MQQGHDIKKTCRKQHCLSFPKAVISARTTHQPCSFLRAQTTQHTPTEITHINQPRSTLPSTMCATSTPTDTLPPTDTAITPPLQNRPQNCHGKITIQRTIAGFRLDEKGLPIDDQKPSGSEKKCLRHSHVLGTR